MSNPVSALGADGIINDFVYHELYNDVKRPKKFHGNPVYRFTKQMYRQRRAYEKTGCDFCITSSGKMYVGWKLPVHDAAMALTIKDKHLSVENPSRSFKVPAKFDPLIIEMMVEFLSEGAYCITRAPHFRRAENADQINKTLAGKEHTDEKILMHHSVFALAEYMGIPELADAALVHIEYILTRRSRLLTFAVFQELIGKIWEPAHGGMAVQVSRHMLALRRTVVTFGAIMEPFWAMQDLKSFTELTAPEGPYKEYAKLYSEVAAVVRVKSEYITALCVRTLMEEAKMDAESEPSRNSDSDGGAVDVLRSDTMGE